MDVDGGEDGGGQFLIFQQASELQQGGGIRRSFARQVDADETADGLAIVDSVLRAFVRESEALLHNVHAQHPQDANRRPATAFSLGVVRFNHRNQVGPRRHRFYISQKSVAPRPLLLVRIFQFGKGRLGLHWQVGQISMRRHDCAGSRSERRLNQRFLS